MNHRVSSWSTAIFLALCVVDGAAAQGLGPRAGTLPPSPTLSPYLNLNRNGNSPGFNYFSLVRPMMDNNAALQSLQQQFSAAQATSPTGQRSLGDTLTTGHPVMFLNTGGYFQNTTGARLGGPSLVPSLNTSAAGRPRSGLR